MSTDRPRGSAPPDARQDLKDLVYKLPGLFSWGLLLLLLVGVVKFPGAVLVIVQVVSLYLALYFLMVIFFYPVGLWRIRRWEARYRTLLGAAGDEASWVRHVVLLPNYKEPFALLARTLQGLAIQEEARERLFVVLAMEEAEPGALQKAQRLRKMFQDRFAGILITLHPAGIPGEVAGKGANQNWAARRAKEELVDRQGIPIEHLTLTSCDADSVLHPHYFAALTRLFASDPYRYRRFWQAPLRMDMNIWQVPAVVRLVTYFANAVQISELANPLRLNFPLSTFSLSFKLADEADYWDSAMIAEDWHMFLRCAFAVGGQVKLQPIFLPTSANAVYGETLWRSLVNSYRQRLRHAWGVQDAGYIMQQWPRLPQVPWYRKLSFLIKVLHDHLIFSAGGLAVAVGAVLLVSLHNVALITLPVFNALGVVSTLGNLCLTGGMAAVLAAEHRHCRAHRDGWHPSALLADVVTAPFLAVISFGTVCMPALHAQTKLMLGSQLTYVTTPKMAHSSAD
ncbi:MAG: glycosyltransferase [Anaerolineae bacterium]